MQSANSPAKSQTTRQQALQQQKEASEQIQEQSQKQDQLITKSNIKSEPESIAEPFLNNAADVTDGKNTLETNGDRKIFFKKIFAVRKKSSIRAKEKKIRQNRHLRKVVLPKNALMALNEVKGIQIGDFVINSNTSGGFTAQVTVNEVEYEGKGNSKAIAKNNACEKALRDLVIAKMREKPRRTSHSTSEPMDTSESNEMGNDSEGGNSVTSDSDVPMINLASFALYKLFSEWESEGFEIPEFHAAHPTTPGEKKDPNKPEKPPKKPHSRTELPPNWEEMHPATLLCVMRPGLTYTNWQTEGEKPNVIQSLSLLIDGEEFVGAGKSKKIARKNAAIAVCNKLFDTNFSAED